MISTRSIFYIFVMIFVSSISFAQNENIVTDPIIEIDSLDSKSMTNEPSIIHVNPSKISQRPSDKTFRKYLELNKKETRFDLNFSQVDQYNYSPKKENNLSLMQNDMPLYNRYSYYQPSFAESFLFEIALGLLGKN